MMNRSAVTTRRGRVQVLAMPALPSFTAPLLRLSDRLRWVPPLLARLAIGTAFVITGWGKLHSLEQVTAFFESLGIPAASLQAPMVATIELVGGALLIAGLFTRIAAGLLIGVMAVALATAILPAAEGNVLAAAASSLEASYLVIFVYLAVAGGGAVALDHVLWRDRR